MSETISAEQRARLDAARKRLEQRGERVSGRALQREAGVRMAAAQEYARELEAGVVVPRVLDGPPPVVDLVASSPAASVARRWASSPASRGDLVVVVGVVALLVRWAGRSRS